MSRPRSAKCRKGHALSGANLGGAAFGRRFCRRCRNERERVDDPHPGFRAVPLTGLVRDDPKAARALVLRAYRKAGTLALAALALDVSTRTLMRWMKRLGMSS
jgi:hypothetical protein